LQLQKLLTETGGDVSIWLALQKTKTASAVVVLTCLLAATSTKHGDALALQLWRH